MLRDRIFPRRSRGNILPEAFKIRHVLEKAVDIYYFIMLSLKLSVKNKMTIVHLLTLTALVQKANACNVAVAVAKAF